MTYQHQLDRAEATLGRIAATVERTEHLLAAVLATLVANRPENMPKSMPTMPGAHDAAAFPLESNPQDEVGGAVLTALPLPPARPAGSEPDLDTALTMGMEAPAPLVPPDRKGPASLYPRSDLTPGVTFPNITDADVKVRGYAGRVRAVNDAMKRAVFLRYGLDPAKHVATEVDHYVSLCLGGTNDVENLWPEPAVTPDAPDQIGFHQKDVCENFLHHQVCTGAMSLSAAQDAIRSDWYAVYLSIPHTHPALMMLTMTDLPEQP